ncbi:MAG: carbohydrate-binding domain-containing protein [Prevotella sp.]|nr:carbohydrate-binding domain-containing protein [Prevotella sp.]
MEKKYIFAIIWLAMAAVLPLGAQTLNVKTGQVTYAHAAVNTGEMLFANGSTLTIEGKTYAISDITGIALSEESVADNTVKVTYNGSTADVLVAGNIAQYLTVTANGGAVSIVQSDALQQAVSYTLTGSSSNGSFMTNGAYKIAVSLNNLSLTSASGPAIDIQNGKAISLNVVGTNTISDAAGGTHTAAFYINGHPTMTGSGSMTISGLTKHALSVDEHFILTSGTINVAQAVGDGIHVDERFEMNGGTVNVTASGDGLDVGFRGVNKGTKDSYAKNGFMELNGGTLTVSTSGTATEALKADSTIIIAGATVTASTSGNGTYDSTSNDTSGSSAVKAGGAFQMTKGTLTATSTGSGGKGINATDDVAISGGKVYVTTTGPLYKYDDLDSKPQGIKSDANIVISGGDVYVCAGKDDAKATAFKPGTNGVFLINGGNVMGVGQKKTTVGSASTQASKQYTSVKVTSGQTLTYDDLSYTVPSGYSCTSAFVVVSKQPVTEFSGAKPMNQ